MELLGTRVVRGRDWRWGNQDGGEGCVGTVVQIGQDKKSPVVAQLVWIQWDCGTKENYRAGVDGKHDLRVFESTNGDIHDISHHFERIDKSQGKGVSVGARQGSIKLEARGIFKGAKVVSGPDWECKESDGGSEMEGEVSEITGWNDESKNDAVRVAWKKGPRENIYRLGKNGKVDLKCTVPVVGGFYYRDHIPLLMVEFKKSQSGFTTGDKVSVQQLTTEKLQGLSAGHGGWNADMEKFIGKVGVVQDFTANGDVLVEYPDRRWRYNPTVLTKIQEFKRGDEVIIKSDKKLVKELQTEHGGWNETMISILGRTGKVLEVDGNGNLVTLVEGDRWMLNPAAVTYVTEPEPGQSQGSSDASSEDPLGLGLFGLFGDLLMRQASGQGGNLSLVNAAKNNQLSRVREILDANPEMIDEIQGGHTALHIACHEGHCDVIRELLDRGASINALGCGKAPR
ncbi:E3 ubiquitin-protein ligase mib2 [Desmophyllum pertusum]|uniref:RING-type E3 ubiquitin transferase n=1 Tax=Desmophyllum pertusum TaxID=174260 RepID=A0A9W9ZWG6_9CNID|nr:E3 ubiquitin-protein ligase mib2 [Desmophyllum pertusum]